MRGTLAALLVAGTALTLGSATARAQHQGHQMPGQPTMPAAPPDARLVSACVQSQQQAAAIADRVSQRLEAARQTNSPADMRAAMDDLQAALAQMRTSLRACDPLQATPSEAPTGHGERPAGSSDGT